MWRDLANQMPPANRTKVAHAPTTQHNSSRDNPPAAAAAAFPRRSQPLPPHPQVALDLRHQPSTGAALPIVRSCRQELSK